MGAALSSFLAMFGRSILEFGLYLLASKVRETAASALAGRLRFYFSKTAGDQDRKKMPEKAHGLGKRPFDPLHGGISPALHLDPVRRPARTVGRSRRWAGIAKGHDAGIRRRGGAGAVAFSSEGLLRI